MSDHNADAIRYFQGQGMIYVAYGTNTVYEEEKNMDASLDDIVNNICADLKKEFQPPRERPRSNFYEDKNYNEGFSPSKVKNLRFTKHTGPK